MFTKEDFIMIMSAIEKQQEYDLGYTSILSQVLKTDDVPTYDHSAISNLLFALLQKQFVPVGGQCEIERYCWELNFGWADGNKVISYDDLWETLIKRQSLNTDAYAKGLEVDSPEFVSNEEEQVTFVFDKIDFDNKEISIDLEARFEERVKKLIELGFVINEETRMLCYKQFNGIGLFYWQIKRFTDEQFNDSIDSLQKITSSTETASRFFPIDFKENYHEDDVHEVATAKVPKHKLFNSVSVGDYHGNHAHYFFNEEHWLEHFNVVKSCDGKIEVEGRVISVISPNELVIEHKKQVVFDSKVSVLTDYSFNKDGFKEEEK